MLIGEDIAAAGGVFKSTVGLFEEFGPTRVRDTPISEQAILGAAMGAAMTGLRPIAEVMFADFFAVCWDIVANEIAKSRYMTNGQLSFPLVVTTGNGGGLRFGAQHSQTVENWAMMIPGLKVVVALERRPTSSGSWPPRCATTTRSSSSRPRGSTRPRATCPTARSSTPWARPSVLRSGADATILLALGLMIPRALAAAEELAAPGIDCTVVDVRSLVPLDTATILREVTATGRLFTVEENPRLCGWGAEVASIIAEEVFYDLDGPIVRITTPHIPLPAADALEDLALPSVERITTTVAKAMSA